MGLGRMKKNEIKAMFFLLGMQGHILNHFTYFASIHYQIKCLVYNDVTIKLRVTCLCVYCYFICCYHSDQTLIHTFY